jgi:hypothetical protein
MVSLFLFLVALVVIWAAAWALFVNAPGGTQVLNTVLICLIVMAAVGVSLFWCLQ